MIHALLVIAAIVFLVNFFSRSTLGGLASEPSD
jgi:hypothetical protein